MEIVRCKNGHRYDPSVTPQCPECARMERKTVLLATEAQQREFAPTGTTQAEPIGKTMPVHTFGDVRQGRPVEATVPVNPQNQAHWASQANYNQAADGEPTMAYNSDENTFDGMTPVVGWLVCISGPSKGKDYRIHEDNNYIGRAAHMDVCISGDNTISRENHAILAYDTREKLYYFAPGSGRGIVRLNGRAVLMMTELKPYDRIEIGKSILMFVPLCGEQFSWEELN